MRKSAFFAIILATLGIAHAPAFGDDECKILVNQHITGGSAPNKISITGFKTGEYTLSDDCANNLRAELDNVLTPDTIFITIIGYASEVGDAKNNSILSNQRAKTVSNIITSYSKNAVPTYIIIAGESDDNIYRISEESNSNEPGYRSVEVLFDRPQLTEKYQTIVFLREWAKRFEINNCQAEALFNEYITYMRSQLGQNQQPASDDKFEESKIKTTLEQCKVAAGNNTDATQEITNYTGIREIYGELTTIHKKFSGNISVWKNADGKFNTARLASDSIAGVVLGTAGGLITSNVVKKNQIENGFEDIKCTIGGQNVAAWGDQFRVGIQ